MNQAGNSADESLPKFFKAYLPDESGDDLAIPISFNSCLPNPLPKTVTVKSLYGNNWRMVLRKCGGNVDKYVLVNGWKRIVKEEVLKSGDFLAFEFDGSHSFNFGIYEHEMMCKRIRKSSVQSRAVDDATDLDEDDDDDDDFEDADYSCSDDDALMDDDADTDDDDERKYLDDRTNPSFTLILNPKKTSQLHIPSRVIKDYGLNFPESITINDPLVKRFGTMEKKIKIQMNGSVFVKGFGSVIRRNQMKVTDKIICEIKKIGKHNLVQSIKIHIIRG